MAEKSKGLGAANPASGSWKGAALVCPDCESPEEVSDLGLLTSVSDLELLFSVETGFSPGKDKINMRTAYSKS